MKKSKKMKYYEERKGIYSLGSCDPRLMLVDGVDIKVWCKLTHEHNWVQDISIQGISLSITREVHKWYKFWKYRKRGICGTMIFSQCLPSTIRTKVKDGLIDIKLGYYTSDGNEMTSIIYGISILKQSWGVSIDDTTMEENLIYTATKCDDWTPIIK